MNAICLQHLLIYIAAEADDLRPSMTGSYMLPMGPDFVLQYADIRDVPSVHMHALPEDRRRWIRQI